MTRIKEKITGSLQSFFFDEMAIAISRRLGEIYSNGNAPMSPQYLTPVQVSQFTGFSPKAMESWRAKSLGPPYLKVGKSIRYKRNEVIKWIESEPDMDLGDES